jgi:CRISPR/Cas system-associated exonuclease Cas4 (RecB family)
MNTVVFVSDDDGDAATTLTPVQIRTLDALRRSGEPVVFDPDIVADIRTEMRVALDDFAERLRPNQEVFISKHKIATALDCEEFHVLPDDFEWKPATAKGQVAHRAIQLLLSWRGEANPSDLVDEAIARLADEERGIGAWIAGLSPADEADLRGQSVERLTKFMESFPPLDRRANPVTEAAARWPNEGPILLQARVDLMIGKPAGAESRKVIIDLKTGRPNARHRQDLGFYALLETLARGVPPRKLATFYLDAAEAQAEDVSERLLRSAVRRTLDGINAIVELESEGRPPVRRPGVTCRWCPLADSCDDGQTYLAGGPPDD